MNKSIKFSAIAASVTLVVACGGGGGGGPTTTSYSGVFFDAPTQGLSYVSAPSGLAGVTDNGGTFRFQAGDKVTFSIPTGSATSIAIGSASPPTPANTSTSVIVPVLSLPNGTQVAQILQTLGGTGSIINVTGTASTLDSEQAAIVNSFISSGGVTTSPTLPNALISESAAYANAVTSISSLTNQTLADSVSNLLAGAVFFYNGSSLIPGIGGGARTKDSGISYFESDYKYHNICANFPYLTGSDVGVGGTCNQDSGIVQAINWEIPNGTTNQIRLNPGSSNFTTVTFPQLNSQGGIVQYINSPSNPIEGVATWVLLQKTLTPTAFANKTTSISGKSSCDGGLANMVFGAAGTTYQVSCRTGGSGPVNGTVSTTTIPGVLTFNEPGETWYIGLAVGGTVTNGTMAFVKQGSTTTCGTGAGRSLSNCGSSRLISISSIN
jgi:hypothetical protein